MNRIFIQAAANTTARWFVGTLIVGAPVVVWARWPDAPRATRDSARLALDTYRAYRR